jgi:hypothetical protein
VFHYTNITDMVYGSPGPFYIERPIVKYNAKTSSYVMWAVMDDSNRSYALSAVMSSPYEDGPFYFRRSLYPDGNRTRDQVLFYNYGLSSQALIGRTYYLSVEYVLPQAIMQPVSVSFICRNVHRINWIGYIYFESSYGKLLI